MPRTLVKPSARFIVPFQRHETFHDTDVCLQQFVATAATNKEAYEKEYKEWLDSHSPLEIKQANDARRRLAQIQNKKFFPLHDPRLVKRSKIAYLFYAEERHQAGDLKYMPIPERGVRIAEEWRGMTAAEKQVCTMRLSRTVVRRNANAASRNTCDFKKLMPNGTPGNTRSSMARIPPMWERTQRNEYHE